MKLEAKKRLQRKIKKNKKIAKPKFDRKKHLNIDAFEAELKRRYSISCVDILGNPKRYRKIKMNNKGIQGRNPNSIKLGGPQCSCCKDRYTPDYFKKNKFSGLQAYCAECGAKQKDSWSVYCPFCGKDGTDPNSAVWIYR